MIQTMARVLLSSLKDLSFLQQVQEDPTAARERSRGILYAQSISPAPGLISLAARILKNSFFGVNFTHWLTVVIAARARVLTNIRLVL